MLFITLMSKIQFLIRTQIICAYNRQIQTPLHSKTGVVCIYEWLQSGRYTYNWLFINPNQKVFIHYAKV